MLTRIAFQLAPNKVARLMRVQGFSIKSYHLSAKQRELLGQAQSFYLDLAGNKIKVFEWGVGPVILLVHGWGGRALQMDSFVTSLLERGFKVVAFDHKGHGESSSRYSSYPEIFRSTELVAAHYAHELYGVIAHSIGSNSMFKVSEKFEQKLKIAVIAPMDDFLGYLEKMRARMGIYEKLFAQVIRQIEADCAVQLADLCVLDYEKISRHDVLLVHDKFDRINKIRASHEIKRNLQGSSLMETEMLGHSRILRNPEVVDRVVAHFAPAQV
ncbi:MAG TPA: alpha/beta fold hydrolase [Gallionellaceae bacterium]|nr:alpha/beta fold hydrolase [Gallionellaceae bacterium]